jgi:hypothetical protein
LEEEAEVVVAFTEDAGVLARGGEADALKEFTTVLLVLTELDTLDVFAVVSEEVVLEARVGCLEVSTDSRGALYRWSW